MNISDLEQLIPTYVGPGQAKGNIVFRNGRVVAGGVVLDGEGEDNVLQPTDWLSKVAVGSRCVVAILPGMRALVMGALGGGVGVQKVTAPVVTSLTLKNGWTGYGSGYRYPEYEVFPDGRVQLHGMIAPGTKTSNTVIATVPASLAPSRRQVYIVGAGQLGAGRVDVTPTGEIILATFGAVADTEKISWLSLEAISW